MENNNKKSKAFIISAIILVVLVAVVFLVYKNRDVFGVKASNRIAKIFSPLETSENQKKELVRAGEDLTRGDGVMVSEYGDPNTVIKSRLDETTIGFANSDIPFGEMGEINLLDKNKNNFWDSFSNIFNKDIKNQCSDKKDNDSDGKTDKDDPECHIDGDINKEYVPDHYSEENSPISGMYPQCSDKKDNDSDGKTDKDDPECHIKGDINKAYVPTHFSESMPPIVQYGEGVDLTAETINPTIAIKNIKTTFSSKIYNYGTENTGQSFFVLFTITKNKDILNSTADAEISSLVPSLEAGMSTTASFEYQFEKDGVYYVRACADKKVRDDVGMVEEFEENNNCSVWTTINITNALPSAGLKAECSDEVDNDGDNKIDRNDPECHYDGDLNKEYVPDHTSEKNYPVDPNKGKPQCSDKKDNDNDNVSDSDDPQCHIDGDILKEYKPEHDSEKNPPFDTNNICVDIENYPITYTDDEQATLDTLLRKFYLISPELFSQEDIALVQRDMDEYDNLSKQIATLTKQCYAELSENNSILPYKYTGPKTQYGNPWYKPESRGSYLTEGEYSNGKCIPSSYSIGKKTTEQCAQNIKRVDCEKDGSSNYDSGCVWIKGDLLKDLEAILNIW